MYRHDLWFHHNIRLLQGLFGQVLYDDVEFSWFRIERLPLPKIFAQQSTKLLVTVPWPNLEFANSYSFYVNQGLQRYDGAMFFHVFEDSNYNDQFTQNYARVSFHLQSFRPSPDVIHGDTFVDLAETIYNFLGQKAGKV